MNTGVINMAGTEIDPQVYTILETLKNQSKALQIQTYGLNELLTQGAEG